MKFSGTAYRTIRIGCAGWSVPSQHQQLFGAKGASLERYATRLDAVEINSSFYRPHQPSTYARWASSVPEDFRFSLKVPKTITHDHRLLGTSALVDRFLADCMHHGVNLVAADPAPVAGLESCVLPSDTGAWRYWRLHGSPKLYYSSYSRAALARLVTRVLQSAQNADVWVVFDNTAHGHAAANALLLKELVADAMARDMADA